MQTSTKPVVKGRRPLGVWILTGYAILFAGSKEVNVPAQSLADTAKGNVCIW